MNLPRISIQRPVLASMMSLGLVLFGLISVTQLPVRELPDIDPPIISVNTTYPGANASLVETEVSEPLEEAINSIQGIKTLRSESREQASSITVEFDLSRDIDLAAQDVRDRVNRVRGRLPDDIFEPVIAKRDSDAWPIIWISLGSDQYTQSELTTLAEKQIKNRLQTVPGVASIFIGGEQRYAMRLWLDTKRMAAHQVTVLDVERALQRQHVELPSGRVEGIDREMTIQTLGEMKTAEEFNRLIVRTDGTRIVRLQDIGQASEGVENERTTARNNGKPCIFLGAVKQSKANSVQVSKGIRAEVERIKVTLPPGVEMLVNYDEAVYVEQSISEVWITLGLAFTLVVVVIYAFLHNFRSTLIPSVVIPVSIVATFVVMYAFGYSINVLTMLALVLAIGIVVDDSVVVLENIHRHIENGIPPMDAAFQGMKEISFAVIATTVALVAVFLPLAFQKSATGRLFIEFAIAIVGAVIISTFVALSLSPMMCSRLLQPNRKDQQNLFVRVFEQTLKRVTSLYSHSLNRVLSFSLVARLFSLVATATVLTGAVVWLYHHLEGEFLPEEDKGRLLCFVVAPEGSTMEYTDRMVREMEGILAEQPEIEVYGCIIAPGFNSPGAANSAIVFVHLSPKEQRARTVQALVNAPGGLRERFFGEIEGAIAIPNIPKAIGSGFSSPFQLVLQGQNLESLNAKANELANKLRQSGYLQNVRSSFEISKPELRLHIDRNRAAALGVSIQEISRTLQILFGGVDLAKIKRDGKEYDVIAQVERKTRLRPQDLDQLYTRNSRGELIQMSSLVTREIGVAPNQIERYNRLRSATISGTPVGVSMGTAIKQVEALLAEELDSEFLYEWAGESRDLKDAGSELWWVVGLALIIVYMVLASQFESLTHPLTVMLSVPLAAVGALGLLWLIGRLSTLGFIPSVPAMNINLFSQIGLVLLIGLVTKNAILLVEFANQKRQAGRSIKQAMLESGQVRLRPILMTAISTMSGILPIAIGFGAGAESRRPMGIVVIGGMATSTFLTLFIIPMVYSVFGELFAGRTSISSPSEERMQEQQSP